MKGETFTLNIADYSTITDCETSPAVTLACAVCYALAVSVSDSLPALCLASVLPAVIMCRKKINITKINIMNAIMLLTMILTWPVAREGFVRGVVISLRVNMIYVTFAGMLAPLGIGGLYSALILPEKLRVLVILTLRGIYIMHERFSAALVALRLRAPELRGVMKLRVFAYVVASVVLQSSRKSERMMYAVTCRGGFGGFRRDVNRSVTPRDVVMCAMFAVYIAVIVGCNYA